MRKMNLVLLFYMSCFFLIWWGYAGYFIFLYLIHFKKNQKNKETYYSSDLPTITILIPCYNEENLVERKIENLLHLDYPKEKLKIIFLDGKSPDNTFSKINKVIKDIDNIQLIQTNVRGKILQLNFILQKIKSEIIINTDMDGILKRNVLIELVKEFQKDKKIGVVGAFIIPENCSEEEKYHWDIQNRIRVLETLAFSSPVIIAVCYAFRNGIIDKFPEDVIADDVYLPFEANLKGYKVIYSINAVGFETRASKSKKEFLIHKSRKANANIVETLRYISKIAQAKTSDYYRNILWLIIFITRAFQILIIPLLSIFFILFSLFILYKYIMLVILLFIISISSLLISNRILHSLSLPEYQLSTFNIFLNLRTNFILGMIMIYSLISYPFYKQSSSYKKINHQ